MRIIDFHTHAFPEAMAEETVDRICSAAGVEPVLDGKLSSLLASMDGLGIEASVVLTIATKHGQFDSILTWCTSIAGPRFHPFASVHPEDPQVLGRIDRIRESGLKGIKLHPYYQSFAVNEKRMFPLYEKIQSCGLILLAHTGFDLGYPRDRIADAPKVMEIVGRFPELKLVTTHIGGWQDWDTVERHLLGRPVYMGISYSLPFLGREQARRLLLNHPKEFLLFGSDSPWGDQNESLQRLLELDLGTERTERILYTNAAGLLGLS